ncbi:MAG: uncharacterized protein KVP18_002283 [Porospora cf. gigantea A]|uniref:uncharacterized protein n=2 Tax=Porospora cf. gigantea A TaxID=2853593 RepID=UPI00355A46A2|nr:MAG: hypothetical protein KVP18_002283 [Porospora cf. gigantea A]
MVVLRDFPQFIVDHQITFMRRFRRGVPQDFRWTVWKAALQWEVMRDRVGIPYASLIGTTNKFSELITIDAPRTFPEIACFDALAEHEIYNILNAFANLHPEVGYCQGMNFVAAMVVLVSGLDPAEEEAAFWVFTCLMVIYDLRGFYVEQFPLLKEYLYAFNEMARDEIPEIYSHFKNEDIQPPVYLHHWFFSLFVTALPLQTVGVIWDCLICEGLFNLIPLSIAILKIMRKPLLQLRFERIVKCLRSLRQTPAVVDGAKIGRLIVLESSTIKVPLELIERISPCFDAKDAIAFPLRDSSQ